VVRLVVTDGRLTRRPNLVSRSQYFQKFGDLNFGKNAFLLATWNILDSYNDLAMNT